MPGKHVGNLVVPVFGFALGCAGLVAGGIGGQWTVGALIFVVMTAYSAVLLAGGRVAVLRILGGRPADEREQFFDLRASAFAGMVTIAGIIGAFFVAIARGQSGDPFAWLGAVAGLSYLAAVVWLRWRG